MQSTGAPEKQLLHVALLVPHKGRPAEPDEMSRDDSASTARLGDFAAIARKHGVRHLTLLGQHAPSRQETSSRIEQTGQSLGRTSLGPLPLDTLPPPSATSLTILPSYDGRGEVLRAAQMIAREIEQGRLVPAEVTAQRLAGHLRPQQLPDPDLIVFTGGVKCLCDSFLWQAAYAEFIFVDKDWSAIDSFEFEAMLRDFARRDRRFGGLQRTAAHGPPA